MQPYGDHNEENDAAYVDCYVVAGGSWFSACVHGWRDWHADVLAQTLQSTCTNQLGRLRPEALAVHVSRMSLLREDV